MRSIGIGVFEVECGRKESILTKIRNSKYIKNIPNVIYRLKKNDILSDIIYKNMNIDIYFIEKNLNIDIFIRYNIGIKASVEYNSILKTHFFRKVDQILYAMLYKVIELRDLFIYSRDDQGYFKLYFSEISYIEMADRATIIHTSNKSIVTYRSLRSYMDVLDKRFARSHSGYIVNLDYIMAIQYPDIQLLAGETILLSKHRRHEFTEYYKLYSKQKKYI